jgi:hypothetical protein
MWDCTVSIFLRSFLLLLSLSLLGLSLILFRDASIWVLGIAHGDSTQYELWLGAGLFLTQQAGCALCWYLSARCAGRALRRGAV